MDKLQRLTWGAMQDAIGDAEPTFSVVVPPGRGLGLLLRKRFGGRSAALPVETQRRAQAEFWDGGRSIADIARELSCGVQVVRGIVTTLTAPNLLDRPLDLGALADNGQAASARAHRSARGAALAMIRAAVEEWPADEHWLEWPFGRGPQNRPYVTWPRHPSSGKRWSGPAVIVAWALRTGSWPQGQLNHRVECGVAECWNPAHVYEGTPGQNALDLRLAAQMKAAGQ